MTEPKNPPPDRNKRPSESTNPSSESTRRLPEHPSLEQLRKQAKELSHELRRSEPSAMARMRAYKPDVSEPVLADAQYVIAREFGFESWPKLVRHIEASGPLEQNRQIAEDLVAAYLHADPGAIVRLNRSEE